MEPVSVIDEELLKSNLRRDTSAQQKLQEPDKWPESGEHGYLNGQENQPTSEKKDTEDRNGTIDIFRVELESRQGGEGEAGDAEGTHMLIDGSEVQGDAEIGGPIGREENDVMDTTELCYDSVLLHALPSEGSHEVQEAPLEYGETYMLSSPGARGVLMATEPAPSSPSTYFQASNMDAAVSTAVSWEEQHSTHPEPGYGTAPPSSDNASPGGGSSLEERAFVDSLCEEQLKVDCLDVGNDPSIPGTSCVNTGVKTTRFERTQSSGVSYLENEYSSVLTTEGMTHTEEKGTAGAVPRKENTPLEELSLRNVLSDPMTGAFMDDAMVAMCGHSFGSGNLQSVLETHSCVNCGASVPPNTLVPNFALRAAVMAYKHEDQSWQLNSMKGTKRRREQFQLSQDTEPKGISRDHGGSAEYTYADSSRPKGVQFPFAVSDRVLIKGNKRTPDRFFGMEAVITSQCLNGWYLVRTVDTGESVRLQYRSLQKLGEMELPFTSEAQLFIQQQIDSSGSPLDTANLKGYPSGTKTASEYDLVSGSTANQQDNVIVSSCITAEIVKPHSSDREPNAPLKQSIGAADARSSPSPNGGTPTNPFQEVLGDQEGSNTVHANVVDDLSKPLGNFADQDKMEDLKGAGQVETLDSVPPESGSDLLNSMNAVHVESDGGQLLHTGLNHDTGAKVWRIGTSVCPSEAPVVNNGQKPPDTVSAGDPVGDAQDVGELPVVRDQGNGNESFRTCSRRMALDVKTSAGSGGFLQDSDPYRKVYTSGSYRRNAKGDSVVIVIPDHVLVDSNSVLKGTNTIGKGSEKTPLKDSNISTTGAGKQERDMKLKSANEILQIMRKDMLKLEKQIPRNYLLRSWRSHRVNWRKLVKASHRVSELGAQVRTFRYSVLLTTAGGMSNEEWDMRIARIIESGDVELLVSLWGRLYDDVYKWLESRPKVLQGKDTHLGRLSANDIHDFLKQEPDISGGAVSCVQMTTAATLAALDAVAEGQQDPDTSIKALLALVLQLLRQQSRAELLAVREALQWEKRHITAKLAHVEGKFANLKGTSEPNRQEHDPLHPTNLLRSLQTGHCASASKVPVSPGVASFTPPAARQGDETEESDSDTPLPTQDADGEATDMSDSD